MITVPPTPPSGAPFAPPVLVRVGDYVFNVSSLLQVKRKKDKVTLYLVGGGWQTFKGEEAEAVWKWLSEAATEVRVPRRL